MLSTRKPVAPHRDAAAPLEPSRHAPAGHASPHTPLVRGGVAAATSAGEAQSAIPAPPAPVVITERQVMLATAAAGSSAQTAVTRRPWIIVLWQRVSLRSGAQGHPRRDYPYRRLLYIEHTAMAREMERL